MQRRVCKFIPPFNAWWPEKTIQVVEFMGTITARIQTGFPQIRQNQAKLKFDQNHQAKSGKKFLNQAKSGNFLKFEKSGHFFLENL